MAHSPHTPGLGNHHTSRPAPHFDPSQKGRFQAAVASSPLASSSDGLQALLRDHPELVSSKLKAAAGSDVLDASESARISEFPSKVASPTLGAFTPLSIPDSVDFDPFTCVSPPGTPPNLGEPAPRPDYSEQKIVVAMVGLPATGKSFMAQKLKRYLQWLEYDVRVFNVGQVRRAVAKHRLAKSGHVEDHTAAFFDPNNPAAYQQRSLWANECLEQLIAFLKKGGNVGIHDATNTTRVRRQMIAERVAREPDLRLIFIESTCTDPKVVDANIAVKVRSNDPDYANMNPEAAKRDFLARIQKYREAYESINSDARESESGLSYIKLFDVGRQVVTNQIQGYLESRIAFYLMNLHLTPRNIFFCRHGETEYNVQGKIGGDSDLSERGWAYARALPKLIQDNVGTSTPLTVWHSTLRRTAQTASFLPYPKLAWKSLDELDAGVCDSMTYEEISQFFPEDAASRDEDKFNYRYRGGESYRDVLVRLEPVIMELERQENILIIGHQAIVRCLYAYFQSKTQEELPYIKIPLHTVIQLTPKAYGCDEVRYKLPIEAVDTYRPKGLATHRSPPSVAQEGTEEGQSEEKSNNTLRSQTQDPSPAQPEREACLDDKNSDEENCYRTASTSLPPSQRPQVQKTQTVVL